MKKLTAWKLKINLFKLRFNSLMSAVLVVLIFFYILQSPVKSYAQATMTATAAVIDWLDGSGLEILTGDVRPGQGRPARKEDALTDRSKSLYVPGNNVSMAHLGFKTNTGGSAGLFVKAGPHTFPSLYKFPCRTNGGKTVVGWSPKNSRGEFEEKECKNGQIRIGTGRNAQFSNPRAVSVSRLNELIITPASDGSVLIQTQELGNNGLEVAVLLGAVVITPAQQPNAVPVNVKAGQRYTYFGSGQPDIRDISSEIDNIVNSPFIQDFINPANWSQDANPQIEEFRKALNGQSKPDLVIKSASIALAQTCQPRNPVLLVTASVYNAGTGNSPSRTDVGIVSAEDSSGSGWGNGTGLPALAAGARTRVTFPVYYLIDNPGYMKGTHQFQVTVNKGGWIDESSTANNTFGPVSITVPDSFCDVPASP